MDFLANINNQSNLGSTSNLTNTSREDIQNNIPSNRNNIYDSNITNHVKNAERDIVNRSFKNSQNAVESGVVPKYFNQSILNNTSQFEDYRTQNLQEDGFVYSKLSGKKMIKEDFTHENMVPFFGSNIKQNMSDKSNQTVLENHTGNIKNFRNKEEVPYMFDPQSRVNHINGSPVHNEELMKRFNPSNKKQQELPIKQVRVGPGINQGYSAKACGGLNQANKRDFIMPKTVDELRTLTNPKKQYAGRIVSGLKSGQRGVQSKINKNNPDRYFNNAPDRYFTSVVVPKNKVREKVRVKRTNRQCSTSYTGAAGPITHNKPEKRGLFRKTRRNAYINSGVRNADGAGKWKAEEDTENYGKNSFNLPLNERDTTQKDAPLLNLTSAIKSIVTPIQDYLKNSKKENFIGNERPYGNFGAQIPGKATVHDPNDVARTTIKETNIHDTRDGNISGPNKITVYDPNDVARTTIKETNIHDTRDGNMARVGLKPTVYDPNDIARTTIKETNIHDTRIGTMSTNRPQTQLYNMDQAKITVRNTMEEPDKTLNMSSLQKKQTVYDPNDIPEATTKDTNIHDIRTGNVSLPSVDKGTGYQTVGIQIPNTNKQFTSDFEYQGVADGDVGKGGGEGYLVTNYEAKNTSKQFISDKEYVGTADSTNDKPMSYDNVYNADLNYNKEKVCIGRAPTQTGVKLNIGESDINIDVKKLESDILNIRELALSRVTSAIPGKIEQGQTNRRFPLSEDRNRDILNPDMVQQFKQNPLTQSLSSY
tara:strand:- start:1429 stop:3717 length:2289 start_codon:yes stop_codon:yes gene_type:complete